MGWHASSPIERIPPHQRPPEVEQQLISDGNRWMDGENYGELQIFLACLEPRHLSSHVALHLQKAQCHSLHRQRNIFSASCCTDLSLSFDVTVSQHVKKSGAGQGSQKKVYDQHLYPISHIMIYILYLCWPESWPDVHCQLAHSNPRRSWCSSWDLRTMGMIRYGMMPDVYILDLGQHPTCLHIYMII